MVEESGGGRAEVCLLITDERSVDLDMRARPIAGNATGEPEKNPFTTQQPHS